MSLLFNRNSNQPQTSAKRSRRPAGISRRKKRQFGFETLEDRRVMSAQSLVPEYSAVSYSSLTPEGQQAILQQELLWYALQASQTNGLASEVSTLSIPSDPLLNMQWHLINSGQQVGNPDYQVIFGVPGEDINVAPVWNEDRFGSGVVVAVIDSGVQLDHPDLAANIDLTFQLDALAQDGDASPEIGQFDPNNPQFYDPTNAHGTAVAGIIAAVANNGIGGSGIAPNAQIVPIRLIDTGQFEQAFVDTFRYRTQEIDITNNSWGPGVVRGLDGPTANELLALRDSVYFGRGGLGVIHVFSAGNSGQGLDTSSYNGWVNTRYTIGVTGIDHDGQYNNVDGTITNYPETSASVLVAAPTGSVALTVGTETGTGSGIWTTDTTDDSGFNVNPDAVTGQEFDRDFASNEAFTSRFNGTSASAPMVSGVIALMLEANPNLSYRDVQEILVRSARQASEFATLADGADKAVGFEYQSPWITNQLPLFHDPDIYDPLIPSSTQLVNPTLDPRLNAGLNALHYAPTPQVLTNGAGYTVSQGRGTDREQTGLAHGVVDAELAVALAKQWTTKEQTLADELTFTTRLVSFINNLPAAERVVDVFGPNTADLIVPGGIGGLAGFSAYWDEYLVDDPDFAQAFPVRAVPVELTVPSPNDMAVRDVEIKVQVAADTDMNDFLDNVRMVLVSPNGTHSELNYYHVDPAFADPDDFHQIDPALSPAYSINGFNAVSSLPGDAFNAGAVDTGVRTFSFSTNRIWGERSDDALIFDPTTGNPIISPFGGGNIFNAIPGEFGDLFSQGWQVYFENYSPTQFTIPGLEITWHGTPLGANTERIQGLIGVDDNEDDLFNYSRVTPATFDLDSDPTRVRLGEVANAVDLSHESMAANITVIATRVSDGAIVDRFVTGADGNFYFDLVPDEYVISIEDPLGRVALDDGSTTAGFLRHFQSEWHITPEFFTAWSHTPNLEVPIDIQGNPLPFLDGSGQSVQYGMTGINFLLDPGPPVAPQIQFSGVVMADLNGDGIFNGNDVNVPNATVFADVNRNGQLDAGEQLVQTGTNGQYSLTVPTTIANVINIGVIKPAGWTFSNPTAGVNALFGEPGDVFTGIDFKMQPPLGVGAGNGTSQSGYLLGNIYEDVNNNGTRQANELGVPNTTVFIDVNNNGTREVGEPQTTTNSNGAYIFANVAPGTHRVRAVPTAPFMNINPGPGVPRVVTLAGGGTVSQIEFGIGLGSNPSGANLDFGDLPASYGITLLSENGARHARSAYYLGASIDVDLDGNPSANADGDDTTNLDDEDGIVVAPLIPGATGSLIATASRQGGNLQGWFDFNNNGVFEASEKVISNEALVTGPNVVTFQIPVGMSLTNIYARFRYGEYGINSVTGAALIGEVEDYLVQLDPGSVPAVIEHGPDFDEDGDVDGRDFLAWLRGYGTNSGAAPSQGDANSDGKVNGVDLQQWRVDYGTSSAPIVAAVTAGGNDGEDSSNGFNTSDVDAELVVLPAPVIAPLSTVGITVPSYTTEQSFSSLSQVVNFGSSSKSSSLSSNTTEVSAQESTATRPSQRILNGVANEVVNRRASYRPPTASIAARLETHRIDQVFEQSSEVAEIGLALLEGTSRRQQGSSHFRIDHEQLESRDAHDENAFDLALSEEVLWRAM
ncbi:S8 family serine peptidase [Bythopirellula polymerisocia]|uniref:Calcium-dependent protease n=1 Tax=Bythopirellula polymerisocia TaxID=2528003 RepID=A0A5C6CU63_9BACT|nr:S8 family serine peptidase [Bythopirellula polymerisocia]TWU28062.1 Calcium-dependent protease precursor [Bythopirellula polymerisocia]